MSSYGKTSKSEKTGSGLKKEEKCGRDTRFQQRRDSGKR